MTKRPRFAELWRGARAEVCAWFESDARMEPKNTKMVRDRYAHDFNQLL